MPPRHILKVFDSVGTFEDYPDQPGDVKCCGASVPMYNQSRLTCLKCGRTVEEINGVWVLTKAGQRAARA